MCGLQSSRQFPSEKRQKFKRLFLFLCILLVITTTSIHAAETPSLTAEADLLLAAGDYAGALAEYQSAVTRAVGDKDYFNAKAGVGKCQAALNQTEAAKETYINTIYELPYLDVDDVAINGYTALVDLSGCREVEPKDAAENLIQGIYLFEQKDYPASRAKYQRFMSNYPSDQNAYYVQYQLARTFYREKDYDNAVKEFQKVPDEYPHCNKAGNADWVIGYCFHFQAKYDEAITQFQKFILDYPDHPRINDARERLAAIIHLAGEIDDKSENWLLAYAIYSDMAEDLSVSEPERAGYAQMQKAAMVLEMAKRNEHGMDYLDAIEECRKISDFPKAKPLDKALALLMEGESHNYRARREKALSCFLQVLEKYELDESCKLACGGAHVMAGIMNNRLMKPADALAHFDTVITEYRDGPNFAKNNFFADALIWKMKTMRDYPEVTGNSEDFNDLQ